MGARKVLRTNPKVSFNTHYRSVNSPLGYGFIEAVHSKKGLPPDSDTRLLFGWTINSARDIRWAIRKGFDAVLTDDPALCKQICESWNEEYSQKHEVGDNTTTLRERLLLTFWGLWFWLFMWAWPYVFPYVQRFLVEKPAVKTKVQTSSARA